MPCTPQALDILKKAKILIAPGKAASAGGVRTHTLYSESMNFLLSHRFLNLFSAFHYAKSTQVAVGEFEQNQEYSLLHWSAEEFESKLQVYNVNQPR